MARRHVSTPPPRPRVPQYPVALVCAAAWFVPGAGHMWMGRLRTGGLLLAALPLMYACGVWLQGEIFSIDLSQPLASLAALANMGMGFPFLIARVAGLGAGNVVAATYEFGNTFLVVAGLLNSLVVIDAYDIAVGRK